MFEDVKEFFLKHNDKFYTFDELLKEFNISDVELGSILTELENSFIIRHNALGQFGSISMFNLISGVLDVKTGGFGFVDGNNNHLFIPKDEMSNAISGDTVLAKIFKDDKKPYGKIEHVIKRGHDSFYGKVIIYRKKFYLSLFEDIVIGDIIIDEEESIPFKLGEYVKCTVIKYFQNNCIKVKVDEILGNDLTPYMDLQMIIKSYNVKTTFSSECIDEVSQLEKEVDKKDLIGRSDFTNKYIVTIDGKDAKDFDDAISCRLLDDGTYELGVYIADVSHYVKDDSFIDVDAMERTTSIYLPNEVIPMLPFELSDHLCSLEEGKIRLVLGLIMKIDKAGNIKDYNISEGFLKSAHRLTYEGVNAYLNNDPSYLEEYKDIESLISPAVELRNILNKKRLSDGAFNFDSSESLITLSKDGEPESIECRQRGISETIIEEFMIVANACVAEMFNWTGYPFIYRVHAEPDDEKVSYLLSKLSSFGYNYKVKGKDLSYLVKNIIKDIGTDESINPTLKSIINNEIIRSFPKAVYSTANIGHFGLALKNYCHFTSPIRRYPDLMVHRLIKRCFIHSEDESISLKFYENKNNLMANISSKLERVAEKLERDVDKYYEAMYMARRIGKEFIGTISSITPFGIYVSLDNMIEGLNRYVDMKGYVDYDEVTNTAFNTTLHTRYHLGDTVLIKVMNADSLRRTIDFKIIKKVHNNER